MRKKNKHQLGICRLSANIKKEFKVNDAMLYPSYFSSLSQIDFDSILFFKTTKKLKTEREIILEIF